MAPQRTRLEAALPARGGVSNSEVLRSSFGLLVQGNEDFDALEGYRSEKSVNGALGLGLLPSSPTLHQRLDTQAGAMFEHVPTMIEGLLSQLIDYGVLVCGWCPLDVTGNGGTVKEGIGRNCASVDCYCPLAAYLGSNGFYLELTLRQEVHHSAHKTDLNLERVIPVVHRLSAAGHGANKDAPILAGLSSEVGLAALMRGIKACNQTVLPLDDWLNKQNPRSAETAGPFARLDADSNTV